MTSKLTTQRKKPGPKPSTKTRPKQTRGGHRPAHIPTADTHALVRNLAACGTTKSDIAIAVGINRNLLVEKYDADLRHSRTHLRAEAMGMLISQMRKGNVAATKAIIQLTEDDGATYQPPTADVAPEKTIPLGKKAQQLLDAQNPDVTSDMGQMMAERAALQQAGGSKLVQ